MALRLGTKLQLTPEVRQMALRVGLGLLLLVAAAYALVGVPYLEARKIDAELLEEKAKLDRRQLLMPTMLNLMAGAQNATLEELVPAKKEPVPRAQAYLVTEQLAHMATAAGLEPLDVTLSPSTLAQDPDSIQAQGVFAGQLEGVRSFLLAISRMPSLSRLDRVEIRAVDGRLEMLLQLRVALSN